MQAVTRNRRELLHVIRLPDGLCFSLVITFIHNGTFLLFNCIMTDERIFTALTIVDWTYLPVACFVTAFLLMAYSCSGMW